MVLRGIEFAYNPMAGALLCHARGISDLFLENFRETPCQMPFYF